LLEVESSLEELRGNEWPYTWLPLPAVESLMHIVHGALFRIIGKPARIAVHLGKAEEILDRELRAHGFDFEVCETCPFLLLLLSVSSSCNANSTAML
jgi:hypothetical protein